MNVVKLPTQAKHMEKECELKELTTDKERIDSFIHIVEKYMNKNISLDFAFRIYQLIIDNAFCNKTQRWFDLRVVKEINVYLDHYQFDDIEQWCSYSKYLPSPFMSRDEAEYLLNDIKYQEIKQMILRAARKISIEFYHITAKDVDELIPEKLVKNISVDKIISLEPLIEKIVFNQARKMLVTSGSTTRGEFSSNKEKVIQLQEIKSFR
jgi:hypothetical protein